MQAVRKIHIAKEFVNYCGPINRKTEGFDRLLADDVELKVLDKTISGKKKVEKAFFDQKEKIGLGMIRSLSYKPCGDNEITVKIDHHPNLKDEAYESIHRLSVKPLGECLIISRIDTDYSLK